MIIKGVICPKCKNFIFSRGQGDFHKCSCGLSFVDGGEVKNSVLEYHRAGMLRNFKKGQLEFNSIDLNFSRADILKEMNFEYEARTLTEEVYKKIKDINGAGKRVDLDELMEILYPNSEIMPDKLTAYEMKDYMERAYKISEVEGIDANKIYEAMGKNNFKFSPVALNNIAEELNLPLFNQYGFMVNIFVQEQENIYYNLSKDEAIKKIKLLAKRIYQIYPQKTVITIFVNDCLERRGFIKKDEFVEIF